MDIKGCVDEIRFRNEENGFAIITFEVDGEPIVAVGTFPPVAEGDNLLLTGSFVTHPKFGKQFKATGARRIQPETVDGIIRYLGSGLIKGLGPKTALTIVNAFGLKTLQILENEPLRLSALKGISSAKAHAIHDEYMQKKNMQDGIMFLQERGIGIGTAIKIYKIYGDDTIAAVSQNPYRLVEDVDGIGFLTADRIAAAGGMPKDSPFRLRAGLICALKESLENGNTCLPAEIMVDEGAKLLAIDNKEILFEQLDELVVEQKLKEEEINGEREIFLKQVYLTEKNVAKSFLRLCTSADKLTYDVNGEISGFEKTNDFVFHETQRHAIELCINNGVSVITGGPGTGKTTIIKCLIEICEQLGKRVLLTAPTGRAAKRLSESTERVASTVHRALMMGVGANDFRTVKTPLVCDVCIVDESSMLDIFLTDALLQRLPSGSKLILVGDKDQLPSVGAGSVLWDVMRSGLVEVVTLTHIYRQAEQSLIVRNAHSINRGEMPLLTSVDRDFFFQRESDASRIASTVVNLVSERLPKFLGEDSGHIQVLCPMKNGLSGVNNLNKLIQERLNPTGRALVSADSVMKEGDKVMHIANNYQLEWERVFPYYERGEGVFNGDMGYIEKIRGEEIEVLFEDGRRVVYTPDIRHQLMLAYAVTVHKSQGSEFDCVVLPITGGSPMILTRNLLYTAITRAKRMVVLVGEEYMIKKMVDNNYIAKRYSGLAFFLNDVLGKAEALYGGKL